MADTSSLNQPVDSTPVQQQVEGNFSIPADSNTQVFMVRLKKGVTPTPATTNGQTMFIASSEDIMLYWNTPHTAFLADGSFGYIAPELLQRIDTPCFKFTFSKWQFSYEKDNELYKTAQRNGADLNELLKRIQKKDQKALLQFFRLHKVADGGAAEAFPEAFWALINLWSDKELSGFIATLEKNEKIDFCNMLIESSYCSPYQYYGRHYPLTLKQVILAKSS